MRITRREMLFGLTAAAAFPRRAPALYPPEDLSRFDVPIPRGAAEIRFGYAAITWGGEDTRAIEEVSAAGFRGIQLRASAVEKFGDRPKALRDLLARHKLEMVALSSGNVGVDSEADEIARHARHAAFVREVGGRYLQLIDYARPKERKAEPADFKRLGRVMTEIGKRAADLGVPVGYHHHMDSLGEAPDEIARVMESVDRRYVKLVLDTAHYLQGGGDPARAVREYRDDILFLHVKDVERRDTGYRFVELGRGRVDLPAVFAALEEVRFRGWAVVELDAVPDNARSPKESALLAKRYVEERLGRKVE